VGEDLGFGLRYQGDARRRGVAATPCDEAALSVA
jgi:hypothetical protein